MHGELPDPLIGGSAPPGAVALAYQFLAHSAPLGLEFYTGTIFPPQYRGHIFVAEHGTEATTPIKPGAEDKIHGDRISLIRLEDDG